MSLFFKRVEKHTIGFLKIILYAFVAFAVEIELVITLTKEDIIFRIIIVHGAVVTVVVVHGGMSVSSFLDNFGNFEIFMRGCGRLLLVVVFKNLVRLDYFILAFHLLKNLPFVLNIFVLQKEITLPCGLFFDSLRLYIGAVLNNSVRLFVRLIIKKSIRRP